MPLSKSQKMFHQLNHLFHHLSLPHFSKQIVLSIIAVVLIVLSIKVGFQFLEIPTVTSLPHEDLVTKTTGMVLPHHDLILKEFPSFYSQIRTDRPIKTIIFLSPNHFQPETVVAKTTDAFFALPNGQKINVVENTVALFPENIVVADSAVFVAEHGIQLHLPYIKKYFSEAEVLPLLVTRNISKNNLNEIITALRPMMTEETLLLVSTDFSHYLKTAKAEKKDAEMKSLITENNYEKILTLNDDYLDCPACIYIAMQLVEPQHKPEILFHSNSAQYLTMTKDETVTSYFVIRW
jgi:AmmeMemoRadiSam system protein B